MTSRQNLFPPTEAPERTEIEENYAIRRLRRAFWVLALLLGSLNAWAFRFLLNPDGVAYLDLADASSKHGLAGAVNAYWSPLYPLLLRFGLRIAGPDGRRDAPAAHFVNFVIFAAALGSFQFLWRSLLASRRREGQKAAAMGWNILPDWAFLSVGFSLFLWTTLHLVNLGTITPDLCIAAFVYLASALVVRISRKPRSWTNFVALGVVLGVGYFAKAPFFLMAFVYLGVAAVIAGRRTNFRTAVSRAAVGLLAFLIISCPLVVALSRGQGNLTFGESGRINYAWYAAGLPRQEEMLAGSTAYHPPRRILESPAVYEFANPIHGTYAPWDAPAYWFAGETVHFNYGAQLEALKENATEYYNIFVILQAGLLAGITVLLVFCGRGRRVIADIAEYWYLWVPALVGMGMYAPIHLEGRFIAGYVVLFWAAILLAIRLPASPESRRVARAATVAILVTLGMQLAWQAADNIKVGIARAGQVQDDVANGLRKLGVEPGDKVAVAGDALAAFWARIDRVAIIAETPDYTDAPFWWVADPTVKARIFQTFARTGAKLVVADRMPAPDWSVDWQRVGNTDYYVHFFRSR